MNTARKQSADLYGSNTIHNSFALLRKAELGKAPPPTLQLPDSDYTYGKKRKRDGHGVRDQITSWQQS